MWTNPLLKIVPDKRTFSSCLFDWLQRAVAAVCRNEEIRVIDYAKYLKADLRPQYDHVVGFGIFMELFIILSDKSVEDSTVN